MVLCNDAVGQAQIPKKKQLAQRNQTQHLKLTAPRVPPVDDATDA